ncbi:cysteine desulfurase [Fodinisporobacter ferrooxydans]|uniref:Cysteine desulfurase n=1 Tax=Fodinisporobacter ferrooxydans TaxID=2901836 RepID=A0ABY4CIQ0_9BACL|nr:cysteine desulfurase [Alicyclobacillaceae bacterium MYW30-H2]
MTDFGTYFDHAATTPVRPEVKTAMLPFFDIYFGNPGSLHQFGFSARDALEAARTTIAKTIGAHSKEIVFTASGTESNNLAIIGLAKRLHRLGKGNHIITSAIEHPSVLETCKNLQRSGFKVTFVPVDSSGRVNAEDVINAVEPETILVSIMHGNNVTGTMQPISEIGSRLKGSDVLFHCDAVQSYGKVPIDVSQWNVDLLTMNAHKIGGPKGVAALYIRKGIRLDPLIYGGGQERNMRSATQNVPGIVGFAKAAELANNEQMMEFQRLQDMRKRMIDRLLHTIPGCKINGDMDNCLPTHVNISIDQIEGQTLMLELDRLGFATSSGSACSSHDHEPSYVLLAMGKTNEIALESLRITLGKTTTRENVDALCAALEHIAGQLRLQAQVISGRF